MAKVLFNSQGLIETPTLLLQHKNFETIGNGGITNVSGLTYKNNFNDANEISFKIHKFNHGIKHPLWDQLVDFRIIYIPELKERFQIAVSVDEEDPDDLSKSITGTALCESELSNINLHGVQINTETDMTNDLYDENFPTVLYRDPNDYDSADNLKIWAKSKYDYLRDTSAYPTTASVIARKKYILTHASLLHRVLEKAPHYSIAHVDSTLRELSTVHEFTFDGTDTLSALKNDIAEAYHCLFSFNSEQRTISVYDLYSTCTACKYRGDFLDTCPECGSTKVINKYGEDTNVLINSTNLTKSITLESNQDSLKNCFYVTGADDLMNTTIRNINPNGSQYIYYFSDDVLSDMPDNLKNKLKSYDTLYNEIQTTRKMALDSTKVTNYNNVVTSVTKKFADVSDDDKDKVTFNKLANPLVGYSSLIAARYDATDLYYYINDSMMPVIDINGLGVQDSLASITKGIKALGGVAVTKVSSIESSVVRNTLEKLCQVFCSTAYYDISVETKSLSAYNSSTKTKTYSCTVTITSLTQQDENEEYLTGSVDVTCPVLENNEKYIEQKIKRMTAESKKLKDKQITSFDLSDADFKKELTYYSLTELTNMYTEFQACQDIVTNGFTEDSVDIQYNNSELKKKYQKFYANRLTWINNEIKTRTSELNSVKAIFDPVKSTGVLQTLKQSIQKELDLQKYLGTDLWNLFYSYRREDDYNNSNYSSTGLNNTELIKRATELFKAAQRELYKAGNLQYSINTTMGNLLALPEFKPIVDKFEVGNFIKVGIDEKVYSLRLLSYQVDYDNLSEIPVEFSTVEKIYSGYSDVESVLQSAKSMSTSYSSVKDQVNKSKGTTKTVSDWTNNGLLGDNISFSNSKEQTVTLTKNGLLARSWDDVYNEFSLKQLKIVNNGLYLTKDGWETIETGVGRFTYTDINGNLVEDYGIIAKTVVGNLIIGKELQIYNEDKSIVIDENGLTIDGGYLKIKGTEVGSDGKTISEVIIDLDTAKKLVALAQQAAEKAQASADKANKATEDLKVETNKIRELAEKGVDHVTTYFYQSDSATKLVGGEWTTNSVTWISGKYVWQKVITYYKDRTDNSQTAKAICISGANGQDGKPGENGVKGKGVKSITPQYAISDSNVLQPNEGWSDKEPEWSEGKYIWTRTLVIYDDNTQETTTPIVSNGLNSALSISTVARKQANTANTNASNALTTATSANTTAKEAETKAQQSLDQFLWLVKSGSSSTSLTLTDSAVAAITKQFIIKSPDGSATIIEGGKLKTDALKSNNYVAGNDGTYSSLGTFLDLSNGEIHTPGFYLDSVGNAFYQGTVNADAGYFGDANNNWYIGSAEFDNIRNKDDALVNGVEYSALISKGNAALTAGHWYLMSQDGSLGIQSGWTTINGGNYVFDKETQKYYDMGMVEPIFGSKNEWDNKFLYIRRVKDPSSSQSTWEYLFKVDKDGTIYENGTKLSDKYARKDAVGSTYLPISGGTVTGNLTVNGTLTATASKANQLTHTLSINGKSWNGSADLTAGTMGVAYGGTGKSSWTANGIIYASASGTLSQLSLGTPGYILQSGGTSAPSWVNPSTLKVASATKATQDGNGNTISDTYLRKDFDSVSQNVSFGGSVDVDDLTAGTLLVSGVARFANGLIGNLKGTASNVPWSGITDKPSTFAPSAHTHTMANISDWETYVYSAQGTRTKNTVLAAPNGSDGKATFRTLVEADIPTLSKSKVGLSNVDNTADSTKNVLSASKLTTARNITIGLAKKSFDGALDISFSLSDIGASSSSHTHNYASKVILAGTDYSCVSNAITITKANLQTAIGSTGLGLMTEKERSKLDSIKVSSGGTIDFSGVTASGALAATIGDDKTVAITHNVSGVKAGTYKSVTVDTYGHVTAGTNPTTLSGYGITDALSSSTKYALSDSVGGNALKANFLANLYSNRPTNANIAITGSGGLATFKATKLMTTNKPKSDGHILHFYWDNTGGYDSQLAVTIGENPELQIRGQQASIWGEWQTVLSSNNYTDYTVKKDGTGASGTWGISITGNAATATKAISADSATKATQDGNGNVISSTYLPLTGGSMTGTIISSSAAQVLRWTSSATSVNSTGCSWYGLGTYRADDGYNWLNISNYWGINFTTTSSNRFTHNGNIIITSANIGSQSVASATKATQDGAGNVITSKYVTIDTTQTISGSKTFSKETTISSATASTSKTTGALKVRGGIASEGQISADKAMIGDAVTLEYNAELQCLNFVFA
nr:MAG TPA: tail fiber protein [Caudoviricetes sp.]